MPLDSTTWKVTEAPAKPELKPLTFAHFVSWLEQQPKKKRYVYSDPDVCAFGQYAQLCGVPYAEAVGLLFKDLNAPFAWRASNLTWGRPHTYGAALERARKLLSARAE